ncbi:sugar ABC transporter permease [Actibacterium mucosum KCTC 23349]|uniref:Sugar ABC transporter permease n=1 Tax=Actibacterium mucosum KCTC 23349 TaxID=1454373 RepID=A0A037ZG96_9RHOB|nr:sugar ABC transporter permease [Actibacterium mucosum]KAJ54643.1 sugar ABC transporter permease [Actibacterium mucosum KCTC 23349]
MTDTPTPNSISPPRQGFSLRPANALNREGWVTAALFLPPALLLFTLFVVLPMGEAAYFSLFKWNGFGTPEDYRGLYNYERLISRDIFKTALWNNMLVILVSVFIQLPIACGLAIILADKIPGGNIFRLLFFLPYVLAEIVAGLIWRFVYDGDTGFIAKFTEWFDLPAFYILAEQDYAMYAILAVIVWKYFGFHMMLFIAGLQAIDRDLYRAARVDGASAWQVLRFVTLPLLKSTMKLSIFFAVLGSLQLFDIIMPMTLGGPSDSTQTMVTYLYNHGFIRAKLGFGSAIGTVLFIICVVFAVVYQKGFFRDAE